MDNKEELKKENPEKNDSSFSNGENSYEMSKGKYEEDPKSPEEEWADTLKIKFTPPPVPGSVPPPIPQQNSPMNSDNPELKSQENINRFHDSDRIPPEIPQQNSELQDWTKANEFNNKFHEEPMPSTYLIWSILSAVFCCIIPGIVAIIFSSQVSTKFFSGDIEGAKRASRMAEIWIIVSFVVGVVAATLYLPIMMVTS